MFQEATATCHKNKIIVYFESHSSLYTHGNEASVHRSTEATIHNSPSVTTVEGPLEDSSKHYRQEQLYRLLSYSLQQSSKYWLS